MRKQRVGRFYYQKLERSNLSSAFLGMFEMGPPTFWGWVRDERGPIKVSGTVFYEYG